MKNARGKGARRGRGGKRGALADRDGQGEDDGAAEGVVDVVVRFSCLVPCAYKQRLNVLQVFKFVL